MAIHDIKETFKVGTILDWKAENKKVYDKIIEKNRDFNVDGLDWYDFIFEDFIEDMTKQGIEVEYKDISFSGFSSQGDGASFTGKVRWQYIANFIKEHKTALPKMAKFIEENTNDCEDNPPLIGYLKRIDHHYSHYNTVSLDLDYDDHTLYDKFGEVGEFNNLESMLSEDLKDLMKDLYKKLEEAYTSLTSDESIEESLEANEYLFDANAKMH
jgi:hypothetical protein